MRHLTIATMVALLLAVSGTLFGFGIQKAPRRGAANMMVIAGCVAESEGHYLLSHAMARGEPAAAGAQAAPAADDKTYELLGENLKAHVGHKVEITGTKAVKSGSRDGATDAHPMAGTISVKSIKMVSTSC
jgi:hypothetical protein